jgi:hypothetical protein
MIYLKSQPKVKPQYYRYDYFIYVRVNLFVSNGKVGFFKKRLNNFIKTYE